MNTVQRIARNTTILLISQIVSYILGFFFIMYTTRYLGAEGFGILSFALAFTGIFSVFTDLGLSTLTVREVARDKSLASKYLGNIAIMKIVLVTIIYGLIALTINLLGYPQQTIKVVYLVSFSVVFAAFSRIFYAIFQANEKMEYQSAGQILNGALMLSSALFAIKQGFSVVGFAFLYLLVSSVVLGYAFAVCAWKFVLPKIELDWGFWKQSIKEAWPMGGMAVCIMIYFRIDTVMLSLMKGNTAVGLYSAAYRLSEMTTIIPAMVATSVFPVMSRYHQDSMSSFVETYAKSVKYLINLALPMALVVTLLARPIINLVYGKEFTGSVIALQILIWAAALMYVTMVQGTTIVTANKQVFSLKVTIIASILNILLNLIVIPRYSYIGASVTTVATEAFGLFIGIFFLNRWGYKLGMISTFLPSFVGLCTAVAILIILIKIDINIFIISIMAVVVYAMILFKIGITENDKQLIKKMVNIPRLNFRH